MKYFIKLLRFFEQALIFFSDYCVGQVRCIFSLPAVGVKSWFSNKPPPAHLAYVHYLDGVQQASIIPVELIQQSVHLIPDFGAIAPSNWKSSNVLEEASHFFVSSFSDRFQYSTLY